MLSFALFQKRKVNIVTMPVKIISAQQRQLKKKKEKKKIYIYIHQHYLLN